MRDNFERDNNAIENLIKSDGMKEFFTEGEEEEAPVAEAEAEAEVVEETEVETEEEATGEEIETESEESQEESFEVTVNGQTESVSLTELVEGYSRTNDYRANNAALQLKADQFAVKERELEAQKVAYAEKLSQSFKLDPILANEPDWVKLAEEDPENALVQKARFDKAKQEAQEKQKELEDIERERMKTLAANEQGRLIEAIPDLKEPGFAERFTNGVQDYLMRQGFSHDEIKGTMDHRAFKVAYDAMRYHEELAKKEVAVKKKAKPKPGKTIKPGAKVDTQPDSDKAKAAIMEQLKTERDSRKRVQLMSQLIET